MITCKKCGSLNNDGSLFCEKCGESLVNNESINNSNPSFNSDDVVPKKKSFKPILIVLIVLLAVGVLTLFFSSLFSPKKPISNSEFYSIAKSNGFEVKEYSVPMIQQYNAIGSYSYSKDNYDIIFIQFSDILNALNVYQIYANDMESLGDSGIYTSSSVNTSSYSKSTLSNSSKYYYVIRVENTLLVIDANANYKDKVKKLVKDMGY